MLIAMYDFMGYYDICYVGGEVRNPARVIPRSIVYSVLAVAAIYSLMNLSIIAVVPWREAMQSKFIAAQFIEKLYGTRAASAVTVLVLWTAFASVFALLLGYSRIPYAAAVNGHFFQVFARLHPTGQFPHVSLLVMGGLSIVRRVLESGCGDFGAADFAHSDSVHRADLRAALPAETPPGYRPAVSHVVVPDSGHHRPPRVGLYFRDIRLGIRGIRPAYAGVRDCRVWYSGSGLRGRRAERRPDGALSKV